MIRRLALAAILGLSSAVSAAPLTGSLVLSATNVSTFAPTSLEIPKVDVYHVLVHNPNAFPATSVGLSLPNPKGFADSEISALTFKVNANLPLIGPNKLTATFFVVPDPSKIVASGTVDTYTLLASNFTTQDGAALIPAAGSTVLAVLSVSAGGPAPSMTSWTGNATINGVVEPILFVLEPTGGLLAGLALVGAAARRRG